MLAQMRKCPAGIVEADLCGVGICIGGGMLALKVWAGLDIDVTGIMPDWAVWLGADKTKPVSTKGVEHLAGLPWRRRKVKATSTSPLASHWVMRLSSPCQTDRAIEGWVRRNESKNRVP